MANEINPRIDDKGVGWCVRGCPHKRTGPFYTCLCQITGHSCSTGTPCLPYARQQAVENNLLREFVQACADGEGNIVRNLEDHANLVLAATKGKET